MERDNLKVACSLRKLGCDLFAFIIRTSKDDAVKTKRGRYDSEALTCPAKHLLRRKDKNRNNNKVGNNNFIIEMLLVTY